MRQAAPRPDSFCLLLPWVDELCGVQKVHRVAEGTKSPTGVDQLGSAAITANPPIGKVVVPTILSNRPGQVRFLAASESRGAQTGAMQQAQRGPWMLVTRAGAPSPRDHRVGLSGADAGRAQGPRCHRQRGPAPAPSPPSPPRPSRRNRPETLRPGHRSPPAPRPGPHEANEGPGPH